MKSRNKSLTGIGSFFGWFRELFVCVGARVTIGILTVSVCGVPFLNCCPTLAADWNLPPVQESLQTSTWTNDTPLFDMVTETSRSSNYVQLNSSADSVLLRHFSSGTSSLGNYTSYWRNRSARYDWYYLYYYPDRLFHADVGTFTFEFWLYADDWTSSLVESVAAAPNGTGAFTDCNVSWYNGSTWKHQFNNLSWHWYPGSNSVRITCTVTCDISDTSYYMDHFCIPMYLPVTKATWPTSQPSTWYGVNSYKIAIDSESYSVRFTANGTSDPGQTDLSPVVGRIDEINYNLGQLDSSIQEVFAFMEDDWSANQPWRQEIQNAQNVEADVKASDAYIDGKNSIADLNDELTVPQEIFNGMRAIGLIFGKITDDAYLQPFWIIVLLVGAAGGVLGLIGSIGNKE